MSCGKAKKKKEKSQFIRIVRKTFTLLHSENTHVSNHRRKGEQELTERGKVGPSWPLTQPQAATKTVGRAAKKTRRILCRRIARRRRRRTRTESRPRFALQHHTRRRKESLPFVVYKTDQTRASTFLASCRLVSSEGFSRNAHVLSVRERRLRLFLRFRQLSFAPLSRAVPIS